MMTMIDYLVSVGVFLTMFVFAWNIAVLLVLYAVLMPLSKVIRSERLFEVVTRAIQAIKFYLMSASLVVLTYAASGKTHLSILYAVAGGVALLFWVAYDLNRAKKEYYKRYGLLIDAGLQKDTSDQVGWFGFAALGIYVLGFLLPAVATNVVTKGVVGCVDWVMNIPVVGALIQWVGSWFAWGLVLLVAFAVFIAIYGAFSKSGKKKA